MAPQGRTATLKGSCPMTFHVVSDSTYGRPGIFALPLPRFHKKRLSRSRIDRTFVKVMPHPPVRSTGGGPPPHPHAAIALKVTLAIHRGIPNGLDRRKS